MRKYIFLFQLLTVVLFFSACREDMPELGELMTSEELKYEITQNPDDPNMIILESKTEGVTPLWQTPVGRSTRIKDTVKIAFAGEYKFVYGVIGKAGYVQADTFTLNLTTDNLNYVNDPLWNALTGGVGNSKTWILDNGSYGLATGPLAYADPGREQVWGNYQPNWEPAGSDIGATDIDYSAEMTFSLEGGPIMTTVKPNEDGKEETGTFSLNVNSHTLSTTDATIIRLAAFIPNADNWTNNLSILELNENQLKVAVMRTNEEGPWWYIFNFVSKEYAENYVPEDKPDPNFDHGDQMQILAGNSTTTWKFATESPFNWTDLDGGFLNGWYAASDYPDWTGYSDAAIPGIENVRIIFSRTGDVTIIQNDGTVEEGMFSIDEAKNKVSFDGIKPSIYISGGWVTATTTDYVEDEDGDEITGDNQWKIVKTLKTSGVTTDIWFGKRDPAKDEYMVFHFEIEPNIPIEREMIRALCGGITGESSRTFKIDLNWPVDWTNPFGEGWTEAGTQDDWYWNEDIAASVADQTLTFSQTDGVVTVTKIDEEGNTSSSPVEIDGETRRVIVSDINIIQFGAGSWLPTTGPNYKWVRGEFSQVETDGFWLGVQSSSTEYTAYHYVLAE